MDLEEGTVFCGLRSVVEIETAKVTQAVEARGSF